MVILTVTSADWVPIYHAGAESRHPSLAFTNQGFEQFHDPTLLSDNHDNLAPQHLSAFDNTNFPLPVIDRHPQSYNNYSPSGAGNFYNSPVQASMYDFNTLAPNSIAANGFGAPMDLNTDTQAFWAEKVDLTLPNEFPLHPSAMSASGVKVSAPPIAYASQALSEAVALNGMGSWEMSSTSIMDVERPPDSTEVSSNQAFNGENGAMQEVTGTESTASSCGPAGSRQKRTQAGKGGARPLQTRKRNEARIDKAQEKPMVSCMLSRVDISLMSCLPNSVQVSRGKRGLPLHCQGRVYAVSKTQYDAPPQSSQGPFRRGQS